MCLCFVVRKTSYIRFSVIFFQRFSVISFFDILLYRFSVIYVFFFFRLLYLVSPLCPLFIYLPVRLFVLSEPSSVHSRISSPRHVSRPEPASRPTSSTPPTPSDHTWSRRRTGCPAPSPRRRHPTV